jgi:hypothetical protein
MDMYIERSYFEELLGREEVLRVLRPYRVWVAALPQPLHDCCLSLIRHEVANSNLVNLPFLFAEPFGIAERQPIDALVVGNAFMLTYFLASDRLFDEPDRCDRGMILLATLLHAEMMRHYARVAGAKVADIWAEAVTEHVRGVCAEEAHHADCRAGGAGLNLVAYEEAVCHKNRYGMAAIPLLATVAGRPGAASTLAQVYDHMAIEIEFDDDLKDWAEDLAAGRFTPAVQALAQAAGSREEGALRRALVTSPAVSTLLDRIDFHLAATEGLLAGAEFPCERLLGWVARHRTANRRLTAEFVARQVRYRLQAVVPA